MHFVDIGFSLQQMAYEFGVTPAALNAFFKDKTGKNVAEYVSDMKIEIAKELLVNGSMSVRDIGMELGYYGQNSFIRRFKQQTGRTPGEYRKQHAPQ
ncbi:MAG: helix-turn-helix transcriptional regulator [Clostridiales bacterium]|nr:helix-turn-helix transcriptional regulator [Clostridiales bacterium]